MFYSSATGGFYSADQQRPADAVPVGTAQYEVLFAAQAEGKQIVADESGQPIAIDPPTAPITASTIDAERDRRIAAGFVFEGVQYQSGDDDRENIAGAATAALGAMVHGAEEGDLRWHGGDDDFVWIATDNTKHTMDALTMFAFGQAALKHKQDHIFAGRAIKDMDPLPTDYADDQYWPA